MIKRYSELRHFDTFEDRFHYLELRGDVGRSTFGFDRWLNQRFYTSRAWKQARDFVIVRDGGCDLGIEGYDIHHRLLVHHMNPLKPSDITSGLADLLEPEFLITVSHNTHNAIHFGNESSLPRSFAERSRGDTKLW